MQKNNSRRKTTAIIERNPEKERKNNDSRRKTTAIVERNIDKTKDKLGY